MEEKATTVEELFKDFASKTDDMLGRLRFLCRAAANAEDPYDAKIAMEMVDHETLNTWEELNELCENAGYCVHTGTSEKD
jgi:hypothetical protein